MRAFQPHIYHIPNLGCCWPHFPGLTILSVAYDVVVFTVWEQRLRLRLRGWAPIRLSFCLAMASYCFSIWNEIVEFGWFVNSTCCFWRKHNKFACAPKMQPLGNLGPKGAHFKGNEQKWPRGEHLPGWIRPQSCYYVQQSTLSLTTTVDGGLEDGAWAAIREDGGGGEGQATQITGVLFLIASSNWQVVLLKISLDFWWSSSFQSH